MQSVLNSVTAALQRKQERQSTLGAGRIEQMFVTDGSRQSSTSAGNIGHSETGLVEAVITALERERKGQLAGGTDRKEHVCHDQLMGGDLQRGTANAIDDGKSASFEAASATGGQQKELSPAGTVLRIEHIDPKQVMRGNHQSSTPATIGLTGSDSVGLVIAPREREQQGALPDGTARIQSSIPTARGGNAGQPTRAEDSLIKARFASTVLRVAQTSDRNTAARLVRGLARDLPHKSERQQIADLHLRAIDAFFQLAASLENPSEFRERNLWSNALAAAHDWLRTASIPNVATADL